MSLLIHDHQYRSQLNAQFPFFTGLPIARGETKGSMSQAADKAGLVLHYSTIVPALPTRLLRDTV
jgi:hypothetical protein